MAKPVRTKYFQILTASARMPGSCWGRYGRVAVVEIDPSKVPDGGIRMISTRARGVVRVIQIWDRLHRGKTRRCAYWRAYREAEAMVAELEKGGK